MRVSTLVLTFCPAFIRTTQATINHLSPHFLMPYLTYNAAGNICNASSAQACEYLPIMRKVQLKFYEERQALVTRLANLCSAIYTIRYESLYGQTLDYQRLKVEEYRRVIQESVEEVQLQIQGFAEKYASWLAVPIHWEVTLLFNRNEFHNTVPRRVDLEQVYHDRQVTWNLMKVGQSVLILTKSGIAGIVDRTRMRSESLGAGTVWNLWSSEHGTIHKSDQFNLTIYYLLPTILDSIRTRLNPADPYYKSFGLVDALELLEVFFKNKGLIDPYVPQPYTFLINGSTLREVIKLLDLVSN